ncbi:hypothetical protein I582_00659 [Enterococcus casseliflavus ATCC 49996]|nr:hypothetical protein UAM_00072 [Enterococcus casseliflavus ATCC 49996]EOU10148.1 hypothetical protein I582_00659 [Enterococcus casseliflavus ATCC 49996]
MRIQKYWGKLMKVNHYTVLAIVSILLTIAGLSWLSYTIINQQQQIVKLEQQLQHEQMKYKIIINDPLVRDAMESGG